MMAGNSIHPNLFPKTPEEELVDTIMAKRSAASDIDESIRTKVGGGGIESLGLELRPYMQPHEADDIVNVDYSFMRLEPRQGVGFGVREIIARFPLTDEDDTSFFNDVFLQVIYADDSSELYLLNKSGIAAYRHSEDLIDDINDLERTGDVLAGDRFRVEPDAAQPARLDAAELIVIVGPAITLTQEPGFNGS